MRKASAPKKKNNNRVHIQAWLHKLYIRESDAIAAYNMARNIDKLSERDAVREAFIAYGIMKNQGWQPQSLTTQVSMTNEMYKMFQDMQALFLKLSQVDFSGAKPVAGSDITIESIQRDLSAFERNSMGILGNVYSFEDDED